MARAMSYDYEGNEASMLLTEGAWTDDDDYKKGGSFATPLAVGDHVEIDGNFRVKAAATPANAIGRVKAIQDGEHLENKRWGTIELFCDQVIEIDLITTSDAITRGASVTPAAGSLWTLDAVANDTYALVAAASASGDTIPIMIGRWTF